MKFGISTYCLCQKMYARQMNVLDVIQWISDQGAEHVEIVPAGFELENDEKLVDAIKQKADDLKLDISNYAITANFVSGDEQACEDEIQRVMKHVDIANRLGVKLMRHDVAFREPDETSEAFFISDLPRMSAACGRIADYAANYGITTSVENHGTYIQASERVERLIQSVNRPNFKTTLDIANFLCVGEDPVDACKRNIPYASMIHAKDFYVRPSGFNPGEGWWEMGNGSYLRGAIFGNGDINIREVLRLVQLSGYDSYLSLEFEGMEDCLTGTRIGLDNLRRIWSEVLPITQ
ncbi:sugar phosphate isomerase/epimerase family protein [Paenibacillus eucommiae]|uniref:Sugar phosphate isomerase/epimerase n=1 Tax=Paenibacillus eucommiae TaxID=1355755 RepID=A0ABS4IT09_9BACL|nr:sugar phosphate isomerase/epimerase family protein [Paenibacillus eucommiae]MBP1990693.1 sugar phosphate isomerase/epimerase [Paenibacillus eucommiae]